LKIFHTTSFLKSKIFKFSNYLQVCTSFRVEKTIVMFCLNTRGTYLSGNIRIKVVSSGENFAQ
jgi:hypothetical protein